MKHDSFFKLKYLFLSGLFAAIVFAGCSLSGDSTLSGTASKGPIASATVSVYVLNDDGTRGSFLGSVTTDADGNYTLNVSYTGPVAVVVTGGSYTDEATGATVTLETGDELVTFLDSAENGESVAITALTTIAAEQAAANAASGIETAINAANKAVADAFGLTGVDLSSIIPADPTNTVSAGASVASQAYGIVMAALTQLASDAGVSASDVLDLIKDLADDYSDGVLDGKNAAGDALTFATAITPSDAMTGLNTAITNFLDGSRNKTGLTVFPSL